MNKKYVPLNSLESPRFAEIKTFMRLPNVKTTENIDYAVIGVPFDTGVTYRPGQRFAPSAIRDISSLIKKEKTSSIACAASSFFIVDSTTP